MRVIICHAWMCARTVRINISEGGGAFKFWGGKDIRHAWMFARTVRMYVPMGLRCYPGKSTHSHTVTNMHSCIHTSMLSYLHTYLLAYLHRCIDAYLHPWHIDASIHP